MYIQTEFSATYDTVYQTAVTFNLFAYKKEMLSEMRNFSNDGCFKGAVNCRMM